MREVGAPRTVHWHDNTETKLCCHSAPIWLTLSRRPCRPALWDVFRVSQKFGQFDLLSANAPHLTVGILGARLINRAILKNASAVRDLALRYLPLVLMKRRAGGLGAVRPRVAAFCTQTHLIPHPPPTPPRSPEPDRPRPARRRRRPRAPAARPGRGCTAAGNPGSRVSAGPPRARRERRRLARPARPPAAIGPASAAAIKRLRRQQSPEDREKACWPCF
jgi:hypothetical protein